MKCIEWIKFTGKNKHLRFVQYEMAYVPSNDAYLDNTNDQRIQFDIKPTALSTWKKNRCFKNNMEKTNESIINKIECYCICQFI